MANSAQAKKRARQALKRRAHNMAQRSQLRTAIKRVISAIRGGDRGEAEGAYRSAVPVIDRMCGKGLIHKNKAARHKSRLNDHIRAMAA